jgi:hypothetical protein
MSRTKKRVRLIATSAASRKHPLKFEDIRQKILKNEDAYLLTFGTGWGIASEVIGQADFLLEPIKGPSDYNHLSVRSAVAISLDRLFGKK